MSKIATIAIQGEPGSFSHEAAKKLEPEATILPCPHSPQVFETLLSGEIDAAVIPIENSLAGSVLEHYDLLLKHDVLIERETLLRIRHNLIGLPGSSIAGIDRVFSHPVALAQCRRYFELHPHMEAVAFYDTAGSVKQLVELRDRHAGAIAGEAAAAFYGGEVLERNIEDNPENYTRFFLIRRASEVETDANGDKVSLAFSLENRPGTLVSALETFRDNGANLTRIESRPVPGKPWEYFFYVDYLVGRGQAIGGTKVIDDALTGQCSMVKILGRYRQAETLHLA